MRGARDESVGCCHISLIASSVNSCLLHRRNGRNHFKVVRWMIHINPHLAQVAISNHAVYDAWVILVPPSILFTIDIEADPK